MSAGDVHYFVLGDSAYGSCCVDSVAAEHMDADVIVHFGEACLSPVKSTPVIYVFGDVALNMDDVVGAVETERSSLEGR